MMNHYQSSVIQKMMSRTLHLSAAALTVEGQGRGVNEDALFYYTDQLDTGESLGLYVICDGMGGQGVGDAASQLAVQTVIAELGRVFAACDAQAKPDSLQPSWLTLHQWTRTAVAAANRSIWECAQAQSGMAGRPHLGAALTLTLIYGDLAAIANVGDCRTYVWRAGGLTQITRDHSLAAELLETERLSEADTAVYPHYDLVFRTLGVSEHVEVDLFERRVWPGDKFLLCSDGIWRAFPDTVELGRWLGSAAEPATLCQQLVDEANRRDGSDDISALVVYVEEQE